MKTTTTSIAMFSLAAVVFAGCTSDYPSLASIERQGSPSAMSVHNVSTPNTDERVEPVSTVLASPKPFFKTLGADEDIMAHINGATGVVLIDFYADWCGPCRKQSSVLKDLKTEARQQNASILKVNVDLHPELASQLRVSGLPTLILVKDKKIVDRQIGFASTTKVQQLLAR